MGESKMDHFCFVFEASQSSLVLHWMDAYVISYECVCVSVDVDVNVIKIKLKTCNLPQSESGERGECNKLWALSVINDDMR